jgi:hypothetical protein
MLIHFNNGVLMIVQLAENAQIATGRLSCERTYYVIGLDNKYYRILNDCGEPILYEKSNFVILDNVVPSDWKWTRYDEGDYYADPPGLDSPGFYENYFDGDPVAKETFQKFIQSVGQLAKAPE